MSKKRESILFFVTVCLFAFMVSGTQASNTATTKITFRIQEENIIRINEDAVSISLPIGMLQKGEVPIECAITATGDRPRKIVARTFSSLPPGVQLYMELRVSQGGTTMGPQKLSTEDTPLVTGVSGIGEARAQGKVWIVADPSTLPTQGVVVVTLSVVGN